MLYTKPTLLGYMQLVSIGACVVLRTACILCFSLFLPSVYAAQLIMIEEDHCPYCQRFNDEIAPAYPNTTEGKQAPLRRVNIDKGWPSDLAHIEPETLTPTFILVENDRELGRMYGYQGDEFFWFLLGELLDKLDADNMETGSQNSKP